MFMTQGIHICSYFDFKSKNWKQCHTCLGEKCVRTVLLFISFLSIYSYLQVRTQKQGQHFLRINNNTHFVENLFVLSMVMILFKRLFCVKNRLFNYLQPLKLSNTQFF